MANSCTSSPAKTSPLTASTADSTPTKSSRKTQPSEQMKALFEVVILPVSDADRSLRFYRDQLGFKVDVDYAPSPDFRVIQLTPHGSNSSIQFGVALTAAPAGSVRGLYLVVRDIEASQ